jgi:hypothetical protein
MTHWVLRQLLDERVDHLAHPFAFVDLRVLPWVLVARGAEGSNVLSFLKDSRCLLLASGDRFLDRRLNRSVGNDKTTFITRKVELRAQSRKNDKSMVIVGAYSDKTIEEMLQARKRVCYASAISSTIRCGL